jgi:hypothetical protein
VKEIATVVGKGTRVIELDDSFTSIEYVVVGSRTLLPQSVDGKSILLSRAVGRGQLASIVYWKTLSSAYKGSAQFVGRNEVTVPVQSSVIEGSYYGHITAVAALLNVTRNEEMVVESAWENRILTSSYAEETDDLYVECTFVDPLTLAYLSMDPKLKISKDSHFQNYDAQVIVPGSYDMGEGDIVTSLSAEARASTVGLSRGEETALPYFHVSRIVHAEDALGELQAVVVSNNRVRWVGREPSGKFSITFMYRPSFTVFEDLPMLRYAENKLFPKKFMAKRYDNLSGRDDRLQKRYSDEATPPSGLIGDSEVTF